MIPSLLKKSWLFNKLDDEQLTMLESLMSDIQVKSGTVIFDVGSAGDSMMILKAGQVRIYLPMASGKDVILTDLYPGDIFGEISLLDGQDRSASAKALTNCEILTVTRKHFIPFMREHPDLCVKLLEVLCGRIRISDERMTDIGFASIPSRLAKILLRAVSQPQSSKKRTSLSQNELAGLIGATRENVNRCLRSWQDAGIVEMDKGWIVVRDPERLNSIAEDQDTR